MNNQKLQNDIDNLKSDYNQLSLSVDEKINLKNKLFSQIDSVAVSRPVVSPFMSWSFYFKAVPAFVLMFAIVGAPISFAAERSLPGDVLYTVKVKVNEEVAAAFVPKKEKDEYYQKLLNKRVTEMKTLAKTGDLDTDALEDISNTLEDNVNNVLVALGESEEPVEDVLQSHQEVLALIELNEEIIAANDADVIEEALDQNLEATELIEVEIDSTSSSTSSTTIESAQPKSEDTEKEKHLNKISGLRNIAENALNKKVEEISSKEDDKKDFVDDVKETLKETRGEDPVIMHLDEVETLEEALEVNEGLIKTKIEREIEVESEVDSQ